MLTSSIDSEFARFIQYTGVKIKVWSTERGETMRAREEVQKKTNKQTASYLVVEVRSLRLSVCSG